MFTQNGALIIVVSELEAEICHRSFHCSIDLPQIGLCFLMTFSRPQQFLPLIFVFGEFCFLGDCWTYYTFWRRDTYTPNRQFHVARNWCSQQITVTFLTSLVSVSSSQIYYHFSSSQQKNKIRVLVQNHVFIKVTMSVFNTFLPIPLSASSGIKYFSLCCSSLSRFRIHLASLVWL